MKKVLLLLFPVFLFSCGTGSYSISSGMADYGKISFVYFEEIPLDVTIDNQTYQVSSVKTKEWQKARKIKQTAKNTIELKPGRHAVSVTSKDGEKLDCLIFISAQEHKIVEL